MKTTRWDRVSQVFHQALKLPKEQREEFLNTHCADDQGLRQDVDSLLRAHDDDDGFLEDSPLGEAGEALAHELNASLVGQRFGHWRLAELIHVGGMGAVFLAHRADGEFEQTAALKVIRLGLTDPLLISKFAEERAYLARMEHHNIARLLDGGTTADGYAYLVMEFVPGEPIDRWSDDKKLSIDKRLELFLQLCRGVQYAHQNLIVHQDIKPGNVLVRENGTPKLLDFGIAKRLSESSAHSERGGYFAMTPSYSSPEQMRGEDVSIATDIYSLGVLLYQLLTGVTPLQFEPGSTPADATRIVSEVDPRPPSAQFNASSAAYSERANNRAATATNLRRKLTGDLDAIVLKALKKSPVDRYASVSTLSDDIERYLGGYPVQARKNSNWYRLKKLARRNAVVVAAGCMVLAAGTVALGLTSWSLHQARQANAQATERFTQVRTIANSMMFDVYDEVEAIPGSKTARQKLATTAQDYLATLLSGDQVNAAVKLDAARGYSRLSSILDDQSVASAGDRTRSQEAAERALGLFQELVQDQPDWVEAHRGLAQLLSNRGIASLYNENRSEQSRSDIQASIESFRKARALLPNDPDIAAEELTAKIRLADTYKWENGHAQAEQALNDLLNETSLQRFPESEAVEKIHADALVGRGEVRYFQDNYDGAVADYQQALQVYQRIAERHADKNPVLQPMVIAAWSLGNTFVDMDRPSDAVPSYQRALGLTQLRIDRDADDANAMRTHTIVQSSLAAALVKLGQAERAIGHILSANAWFEQQAIDDPDTPGVQRSVAISYHMTGDIYRDAGRADDACAWYRRTLAKWQQIDATLGIAEFDSEEPNKLNEILADC